MSSLIPRRLLHDHRIGEHKRNLKKLRDILSKPLLTFQQELKMNKASATNKLLYTKPPHRLQIRLERISSVAGVQISGIDLREPLPSYLHKEISEALVEHHVLVFKDQVLTKKQQAEFSKNFGELEGHVGRLPDGTRFPVVHTVTNISSVSGQPSKAPHTDGNYYWHTDKSYHAIPSFVTLLHAIEVPPTGGDTLFCNMHMAYEALSNEQREFFSKLKGVHSWEASRRNTGNIPATEQQKQEKPPVSHPIIRTHPDSGRKALYLGMHIGHIEGLPESEGKQMLNDLLNQATVPENIYRHSWQPGDLVVWDNRCLLHRADRNFDMSLHRRILHRTVVKGTVPF
tara:strand:- start:988 stop:2013 length:1026 start_codon:yes stop_codon:yes gene_type:complete